jgi:ABC-type sugar transport system substrate-binding protein
MKRFGKLLALFLAIALIASALASCGAKDPAPSGSDGAGTGIALKGKDIRADPIKIAYITLSTAGIGNRMHEVAYEEQLSYYPNVDFQFFDGEYSPDKQRSLLNECVTQKYDAVIIEAMGTEELNRAIVEAEEAGIPVITMNSGASALHTLHIEGSDYEIGYRAAEILGEAIGGSGNAILLDVPAEQKAMGRMGTGFEEGITEKFPDIKLLEKPGIENWSQENANTTMRDLLTKYPNPGDINIIYGASDDIAIGAIQAIDAAGRADEGILVFGNMGYPTGLQSVKNGSMFGTGFSDIYLEDTSSLTLALYFIATGINSISAGYASTPVISMYVPPITSDNIESYIEVSHWKQIPGAFTG